MSTKNSRAGFAPSVSLGCGKEKGWRLLGGKKQPQLPSETGLAPKWRHCGCCPEHRGGTRAEGGTSSWGSEKISLGRSHGLATSLLALPAGDLGRALSYPSFQELSSQTLLDPGRTVLPDVWAR